MYEAVINKSELEIRRSLYETKKFIDKVLAGVKESCIELDQYILSQGIYKKFIEEYIPIFKYLEHKYGLDSRILFRYVGIGNQGYDAEIKVDDQVNNIPKKIEIAYLLLGKESKERSREIVKEGSSFRIYQPEEKLYEIKNLVIKVAKNKALKLYSDTLLLLYLPCKDMYRGDYILPEEEFNNMIYDLKNISYNANKVDLFIPGKSVTNNLGERKLPPEIYSIK